MKYLSLFLIVFLYLNSFAQNRKKLLKEVKTFKQKTYYNASYDISSENLETLIFNYFSKYKLLKKDSNVLTLYKIEDLEPNFTYEEIKHKLFISIKEDNNLKKVELDDKVIAYSEPFTPPIQNNPIRGGYKINKKEFYKNLYNHTNQDKIRYPKELIVKIKKFNEKQSNTNKKLIIK